MSLAGVMTETFLQLKSLLEPLASKILQMDGCLPTASISRESEVN